MPLEVEAGVVIMPCHGEVLQAKDVPCGACKIAQDIWDETFVSTASVDIDTVFLAVLAKHIFVVSEISLAHIFVGTNLPPPTYLYLAEDIFAETVRLRL